MTLNRQIAFLAVLIASAVMFVHAVVPHHHRASDLAMCTVEEPKYCRHSTAEVDQAGVDTKINVSEADCNNCSCDGVKCAPTLPFMFRCGAGSAEDGEHSHDGEDVELLPLLLVGVTDDADCLASNLLSENLYLNDGVMTLSECLLESLSRRGPPAL